MATNWPIVFNLVNSIIGVSVLAMPFCFYECGIILGPLLMITSGFLTKCSCELLLKGAQVARKRSYELLALHTYGTAGKLAVQGSIIGLMIGTLIAFNVIVGDLAPSIFQGLSGVQVTPTVRAVVMFVMSLGIALPLCMMRNIQSLAAFSSLALIFYVGFVTQMLFTSFPNLYSGFWTRHVYYWRPSGILSCLPIFSLAFACQTQLFVLYDSLPEPSVKKMQNVVNTAMNIVSAIYLLVGVLGYICFYDVGVKGDVLTNYGKSFVVLVIKCGFMFSVLVSFPLMMFPIRESINNLITLKTGAGMQDNLPGNTAFIPHNRFVYITVSVLLLTLTVGILLPHIEFVLALTGATMGTLIAFIYPASMYLHVVHEKTTTRLMAKTVVVVGLVCLVGSTYAVLTASNNHEHEVKNVHPPGIDPIKPVPGGGNKDAIKLEDKRALVPDSKAGGGETNKATVDKPSELKVTATPFPTAGSQKVGEVNKAVEEGLKKEEAATTVTKEGELRKEPPVPDAPDAKGSVTVQPVKPDARVLMSQNDSDEKEKGKEKDKEIVKDIVTSAPQNSTETGANVVDGKESKLGTEVKRIKKRDVSDASSTEAAVIESPEKEKEKQETENQITSVATPTINGTLAADQVNDANIRKPARDLKSSKDNEKKHKYTGEDKELEEKRQINEKLVNSQKDATGFSKNVRKLLGKNGFKRVLWIKNQKAMER